MADLHRIPDAHDPTRQRPGSEAPHRGSRSTAPVVFILVKLLVIAFIVVLPSQLAISLGAAHGVLLLVLLISAAASLLIYRRRGRRLPSLHAWLGSKVHK